VTEVKQFFQHTYLPFGTFLSKETDLYVGQLKIEIFFLRLTPVFIYVLEELSISYNPNIKVLPNI